GFPTAQVSGGHQTVDAHGLAQGREIIVLATIVTRGRWDSHKGSSVPLRLMDNLPVLRAPPVTFLRRHNYIQGPQQAPGGSLPGLGYHSAGCGILVKIMVLANASAVATKSDSCA